MGLVDVKGMFLESMVFDRPTPPHLNPSVICIGQSRRELVATIIGMLAAYLRRCGLRELRRQREKL
jgi:hypothetical protein